MKKATERGQEMMLIKMGELPKMALDFLEHLVSKVGMCMETCLTAYTVYAQIIEGLSCDDSLYKARDEDIIWFKENS